jgi:hypothetical protein
VPRHGGGNLMVNLLEDVENHERVSSRRRVSACPSKKADMAVLGSTILSFYA